MKPRQRLILITAALVLLTFFIERWWRGQRETSQDQNILLASRRYQVDPALIKALIWRESRFDPLARGRKSEVGLMQIMPETTGKDWALARKLGTYDGALLFNAATNVDCGTWYLRKLLVRYQATDNPIPYALADYNAGRTRALQWMKGPATTNSALFIDQIAYPSTRDYVRAIMKRRLQYEKWAANSVPVALPVTAR
jgi:soluble lytic murein transglycosylase